MNKTHHYYSLDFFRGVCGYGVAITHLYAFMMNSEIMEYFSLLFEGSSKKMDENFASFFYRNCFDIHIN